MRGRTQNATMRIAPDLKRRLIWSVAVFPFYLAASFFGDARSAGNPFELGIGHGVIFGIFAAIFLYPMFLGIQAIAAKLVRLVVKRPKSDFTAWEFAGIAAWCLLVLSSFTQTSDRAYYKRFVSDDVPVSLAQVQCRHSSGFGNSQWAISFALDPAEFPKVLARHEYTRTHLRKMTDEELDWPKRAAAPDELALDLSVCDWTEVYQYIKDGPGGGLRINIYTNDKHDLVYVRGSFD